MTCWFEFIKQSITSNQRINTAFILLKPSKACTYNAHPNSYNCKYIHLWLSGCAYFATSSKSLKTGSARSRSSPNKDRPTRFVNVHNRGKRVTRCLCKHIASESAMKAIQIPWKQFPDVWIFSLCLEHCWPAQCCFHKATCSLLGTNTCQRMPGTG